MSLTQFIAVAIALTVLGLAFCFGFAYGTKFIPPVISQRAGRFIMLGILVGSLLWSLFVPRWIGSPWWLAILLAYSTGRRVERAPKTSRQEVQR